MKITEHFTKAEMERSSTAARLGLANICPPELVSNMVNVAAHLETIRAHFNSPIHVTSCYRSPAVNSAVGGSSTSAHRYAHAADFEVQGVANIDLCRWAAENIQDFDQIIYEFGATGWCHIGFTSGTPRKQILSAVKIKNRTVYRQGLSG
jgi:zinc D-Ala-D-Ala carboxypeptidase